MLLCLTWWGSSVFQLSLWILPSSIQRPSFSVFVLTHIFSTPSVWSEPLFWVSGGCPPCFDLNPLWTDDAEPFSGSVCDSWYFWEMPIQFLCPSFKLVVFFPFLLICKNSLYSREKSLNRWDLHFVSSTVFIFLVITLLHKGFYFDGVQFFLLFLYLWYNAWLTSVQCHKDCPIFIHVN